MTDHLPPGVQNHNPFDMMYDHRNAWIGQIVPPAGHRLLSFDTAIHGIRAGMKDAHTKVYVDGLDTLEKLIPKFAPPNENDTAMYIRNVRTWLIMSAGEKLDIAEPAQLIAYARAIIREEVGLNPATDSDWYSNYQYLIAANMALGIS